MKDKPGHILYKNLLVRNKLANWLLQMGNNLFQSKSVSLKVFPYKRILVCNNAHLGDVILSTSILPVLKYKFPDATIDFLCGTWSKEIVFGHPLVNKVYFYDHWKLNRTKKSLISKFKQHFKSYNYSLKEIKKNDYDIAIDLYFFYPNSIFLLWRSKIPIRLGYSSGGFGNLLTRQSEWMYKKQSVVFYHLDLIRQITDISDKDLLYVKPNLPLLNEIDAKRTNSLLSENPFKYIVIQVGTSLPRKEWPLESWKELIVKLDNRNFKIVFTGYGSHEEEIILQLEKICTRSLNLCNKTTLQETGYIIKNARALICVDSVAGHLASAYNTPSIVIGNGINNEILWKPFSDSSTYLVDKVKCMPCYTGCATMECIRNVGVNSVLLSIEKILRNEPA